MSLVDEARPLADRDVLHWIVYGLAAGGAGLALAAALSADPISTALAVAAPLPALGLALTAPDQFEVKRRGGGRGFNPVVGGGALALLLVALGQHLLSMTLPLTGALVCAAAALALAGLAPGRARLQSPIQYYLVVAVLAAIYGASAAALVDVRFDASAGSVFPTTVTAKRISNGKSTHYYLVLAPWGPQVTSGRMNVSRPAYDVARIGDRVCVTQHPGALGARWVTYAACQAPGARPSGS